ncbi:MAG: translation initiation factor IF-2 [Parachlamydia sp.]|nr:translation initiation factor IF-2 [Parachlamydia sp.]
MAKQLKINIKNTQIAEAINLKGLKNKLAAKKEAAEGIESSAHEEAHLKKAKQPAPPAVPTTPAEEAPRIKARSRSAFADQPSPETKAARPPEEEIVSESDDLEEEKKKARGSVRKTSEELRQEIFGEEIAEQAEIKRAEAEKSKVPNILEKVPEKIESSLEQPSPVETKPAESASPLPVREPVKEAPKEVTPVPRFAAKTPTPAPRPAPALPMRPYEKLGPTGRHIKDLLPPKPRPQRPTDRPPPPQSAGYRGPGPRPGPRQPPAPESPEALREKAKLKARREGPQDTTTESEKGTKVAKFKEFKDIKPAPRKQEDRSFDARDRQGLRATEDDGKPWRKKRAMKRHVQEDVTIRPTQLKVRIPIAIKDLAAEMKLKSSQLVQKLFLQGLVVTLNDMLEDETTIQLLGQEFGCEITIDTSEEERLRITDKTVKEEIKASDAESLVIRPPVVAFMGHVDHGKTSLIDTIRKSNRAAGEAGAITQHIGAFLCTTPVGNIAILDTPGHEAFSAMRARGADVTDIVVLVVAGDEGIKQQTLEAIQRAREAKVTIVVAINKADRPNFNAENVYRQLSEQELLPEAWGGQTITINCSAVTGQGIPELLEMLALQAEVLELKANPQARARGRVLESEMHKGMGAVATILIQNGSLKLGDSLVFDEYWGRVKTMRDEFGQELQVAGPSAPVAITGLSGLPEAGQEFIVVKSEKEAREIAEDRRQGLRLFAQQQKKKVSMESLLAQASVTSKKVLNLILRADVQGSLEALKNALDKIQSTKAEINIISSGVGEVSESDVQLAAVSKAVILGFHTAVEGHAEPQIKQLGVQVRLHDIIYHAVDDMKLLLVELLDKLAQETEKGKALVKTTFKSSQVGVIAGCQVTEGTITRSNNIRVIRDGNAVWKGAIASLKRVKEDVREVQKGLECGILLSGFTDVHENDILEAYEITYIKQEL